MNEQYSFEVESQSEIEWELVPTIALEQPIPLKSQVSTAARIQALSDPDARFEPVFEARVIQ